MLRRAGIWDELGDRIHTSTNDAVTAIHPAHPAPADQRRHGIDERTATTRRPKESSHV